MAYTGVLRKTSPPETGQREKEEKNNFFFSLFSLLAGVLRVVRGRPKAIEKNEEGSDVFARLFFLYFNCILAAHLKLLMSS